MKKIHLCQMTRWHFFLALEGLMMCNPTCCLLFLYSTHQSLGKCGSVSRSVTKTVNSPSDAGSLFTRMLLVMKQEEIHVVGNKLDVYEKNGKNQLTLLNFTHRNVLSLYGEVYFRAWRVASGAYLKVLLIITIYITFTNVTMVHTH